MACQQEVARLGGATPASQSCALTPAGCADHGSVMIGESWNRGDMSKKQGSERVLVVDDEQVILDLLERVLGREGYQVTTANCGEDVVGLLSNERFDLAIMDMGLRNPNGGNLMKAVREASPGTAIVVMTGYPMEEVIRFAQQYAQGYLEKPFDLHELLAVARDALRQALMPGSSPRSARIV